MGRDWHGVQHHSSTFRGYLLTTLCAKGQALEIAKPQRPNSRRAVSTPIHPPHGWVCVYVFPIRPCHTEKIEQKKERVWTAFVHASWRSQATQRSKQSGGRCATTYDCQRKPNSPHLQNATNKKLTILQNFREQGHLFKNEHVCVLGGLRLPRKSHDKKYHIVC